MILQGFKGSTLAINGNRLFEPVDSARTTGHIGDHVMHTIVQDIHMVRCIGSPGGSFSYKYHDSQDLGLMSRTVRT